jgi:uncharacterized protein (TIGR01777 family)
MNVVVAGGSGLLGTALLNALHTGGHTSLLLSRNVNAARRVAPSSTRIEHWDGRTIGGWAKHVDGADAVVNLAGSSIGGGRWTARRKQLILESRINATRAIVGAIERASKRPRVLVNQSAVGYYGHVPEGEVTESHPRGNDFLAKVCLQWEEESKKAATLGVRVVNPRTGIVLAENSEAVRKLLLPFKLFVGGPLGTGRQWFPWIHLQDEIGAMLFAMENDNLDGPVNFTAPNAVTMREFCTALGKAINRPSWAPVPSFALELILGEMSLLVLKGQRAIPKKLLDAGYRFKFEGVHEALRDLFE